jgi:hypothetical protein
MEKKREDESAEVEAHAAEREQTVSPDPRQPGDPESDEADFEAHGPVKGAPVKGQPNLY